MAAIARKVTLPRTFYRINSNRVSLREYWWGTRSPMILVALLLKALRVRLPSSTDDPNVESLKPFEVEAGVATDNEARTAAAAAALEALGFRGPIYHAIGDDLHKTETALITFTHESGIAWGRVHERRWNFHTPPKEVLFCEFVTPLQGGAFLWSLSSKADLAAPPPCTVVRRQGAAPDDLWAAHQEALRKLPVSSIARVGTDDDLRAAIDAHHRAVRNFHLRRGVFSPLTSSDRQAITTNATARAGAAATGARFPEVLAEMRRLQEKKSSWTTGVVILAVSLAAFLGTSGMAGFGASAGGGFSFEALAILVGVVAFHEAGHFAAMKLFDYRNVQMFFIPFLGAAVSGRHYNVAGWKKAVVSLMGPLPGVLVGSILAAVGLATSNALMLRIAMTALALNGFNLLPVLPLDGGWVVQAVLASRHALIELAFRVLAAAAFLGASAWSGDWIFLLLAFVIAAGIPLSYRTARIAGELRKTPLEPLSADDHSIPAATADTIVARLVEAAPKKPTKQIAQQALQVFEALNSRPPGIAASLALGLVQMAGLGTAIVFAVLTAVGQRGDLTALLDESRPTHEVSAQSVVVRRPLDAIGGPGTAHNTVVATFTGHAAALVAAADLAQRSEGAVAILGDTMLLALPAADDAGRKRWLDDLQPRASDVFVSTPQSPGRLDISCLAGSEAAAERIEHEAGDYFHAGPMQLLPPWARADSRTPDEAQQHARARRTHARLQTSWGDIFGDPALERSQKATSAAMRAGDAGEVARLQGEMTALMNRLRREHAGKLRSEPALDSAFVDRYLSLDPATSGEATPGAETAAGRIAVLGPLMGQMALVDGRPDPAADVLTARGVLTREGLFLRMPFLVFHSAFEGPLALVGWLERNGCIDIRYQFGFGSPLDEEGDYDERE